MKDIKPHLLNYLESNRLMSLASYGNEGVWASTVFFAYDNHLNIYFYSHPDTKHCKNLLECNRVALTVNQDWGGDGFIKGMQYVGKWVELDGKQYEEAFKVFSSRHKWADKYGDHKVFMIEPVEVWMIDSKKFGQKERMQVL